MPILSITMRQGIVFQSDRFKKVIASSDTNDYKVIRNGQLVIAFPIDEGLIYTQDIAEEGIMSPAYNIWDVDYTNINRRFLNIYFHCPWAMNYYKSKLRGTTLRRRMIPKEDLLALPIPLPPLPEQEKIVAELDFLSGIIEKKKQQLKELDALAQSIFYEMFGDPVENEKGWEVKKLGEVASSQIGLTYKPENVSDNEEGVIVLRSGNIQDNEIDLSDIVRVNCPIKVQKIVQKNDILMCSRNGSHRLVGKVAMIPELKENMTYGAFMTIIRSNYQYYLFEFFKSPYFRMQLSDAQTSTINQITVKMLNDIRLSIPPIELEHSFASKLEAIEKQKELIKQSIAETELLFNSRMQYYFG